MTKKQFTKLSEFEDSFAQAQAGYYRALLRTDVEIMANIYKELGYEAGALNCNRCILAMLLNLAKEYNEYKNKHLKKDEA